MTDDLRKALPGRLDPLPADLVRRVGEALYGPQWVAELARALGVAHRTVERWKAGDARATPRIAGELLALLEVRATQVSALARELKPIAQAARDADA